MPTISSDRAIACSLVARVRTITDLAVVSRIRATSVKCEYILVRPPSLGTFHHLGELDGSGFGDIHHVSCRSRSRFWFSRGACLFRGQQCIGDCRFVDCRESKPTGFKGLSRIFRFSTLAALTILAGLFWTGGARSRAPAKAENSRCYFRRSLSAAGSETGGRHSVPVQIKARALPSLFRVLANGSTGPSVPSTTLFGW